jgi:hypothetical protein
MDGDVMCGLYMSSEAGRNYLGGRSEDLGFSLSVPNLRSRERQGIQASTILAYATCTD